MAGTPELLQLAVLVFGTAAGSPLLVEVLQLAFLFSWRCPLLPSVIKQKGSNGLYTSQPDCRTFVPRLAALPLVQSS